MRKRRQPTRVTFDAAGTPALAAFARAYLHEDLLIEYGSAADAVEAFCRDTSAAERRQLADDLARLAEAARAWTPATLARVFTRTLGAAWRPRSAAEVLELAARARAACDAR